jgi:hypothetical protein
MSTLKIMTSEGELVEIEKEAGMNSIFLRNCIEDFDTEEAITLDKIGKDIFIKIKDFLEYIKENSPPKIERPL